MPSPEMPNAGKKMREEKQNLQEGIKILTK